MENIIQRNTTQAYQSDMAIYAIETNRRRAFADYKDGMKLCQRRIIYAMAFDLPCKSRLVKTAKVTGQVMGTYHPHGDTSISDAIKPLCNWFETYIPLLWSESNMGSMQGDRAAAPRYTEVMLNRFTLDYVLKDVLEAHDVVDWVKNYSGDKDEPESLPVAVPLLLINGTYGIGTGKAVSIPPHNTTEVIDATLRLLDDPNAPVVLVPDQCMPCDIIDNNWKQISNTGSGKFTVRAHIDIEIMNKGTAKEHQALIIKSVPNDVFIDKGNAENGGVIYQIYDLIDKGKLPQITRISEDSHDNDMRITIELKPGADANYVKEFLFKTTQLQKSVSVNFEVLDGIELVRFSYKSYLQAFLEQRRMTKFRLACIRIQDCNTKIHEKEIYIKALQSGKIDQIIDRIKKTRKDNDAETIEWLSNLLKITDLQAKFILNSPLKSLSMAHLQRYISEAKELQKTASYYTSLIMDDKKIDDIIRQELLKFRQEYGCPRRCRIISKDEVMNIPAGEFNIVITENNYIKKLSPSDPAGAYKGDNPIQSLRVDNTKDIIMVTAHGRMYRIPIHKIPLTEKNSIGTDIRVLVKGVLSNAVKILYSPWIEELAKRKQKHYAIVVTKKNYIKKLDLDDIMIAAPSGIIMTKLTDGDEVKDVLIAPDDTDVVVYSDRRALRFPVSDVPHYKRSANGVAAMNTTDDIDGASIIWRNSEYLLVITKSGKVNKIPAASLQTFKRYKAGSSVIKLGKTDSIHSIIPCNDTDVIEITTKQNKAEFAIKDIQISSSISGGVQLLSMKSDTIVNTSLKMA